MAKLVEGYQAYEVLLAKFKEEFGEDGVIDVSETQIMAVGTDTYITKHVVKVFVKDKLRASAVINSIDADMDDSAKAESKAIRRALARLPGFSSIDLEATPTETLKTPQKTSAFGSGNTDTQKPAAPKSAFGIGKPKVAPVIEDTEDEEDDEEVVHYTKPSYSLNKPKSVATPATVEEVEEEEGKEEEVQYTKPTKMSPEEILNKYRKKA